jgi:hypothetical protein
MPNPASSGLPNPSSYDTSVADIVTDKVTGLMWERTVNASLFSQAQAAAYCAANRLGGFSNWRLPSVLELVSIINFTTYSPALDTDAFPQVPGMVGSQWSSTPAAGVAGGAWYVASEFPGSSFVGTATDSLSVRCVRAGGAPATRCYPAGSRYQVQAGAVVLDAATGLTWQQVASVRDWTTALTSCPSGFRVPSMKELQTIVDYTRAAPGPTVDTTVFFNSATTQVFWTSSTYLPSPPLVWIVDFTNGTPNGITPLQTGPGGPPMLPFRCVR